MNVSSFAELLQLQGYGLYVWPAYAAMLAGVLVEPWLIRRRLDRARAILRELGPAGAWDDTRPTEDHP